MQKSAKIIAVCSQKGGVGKTTTTVCLGVNLARQGKKVLLVDFDPQGNLTKGFGFRDKTAYPYSIKDVLLNEVNGREIDPKSYVLHAEGLDFIPANIDLAGADLMIAGTISRETLFKRFSDKVKEDYDEIIIDGNPALNLFTIDVLTAADSVIIPVQAEPYATDGLNDLLHTIDTTRRQLNPSLKVEGILLTMLDSRTNLSKHIANEIRELYGGNINVFNTVIPRSVKVAEASLEGESPVKYAPNCEAVKAYEKLTKEVLLRNGERTAEIKPRTAR